MRPRRLVALLVGVLVLVVAGAAAYFLLPPRQTESVSVPASDATPEEVVGSYLEALNAHDCVAAQSLATEEAKDSARSWCENVASLTDVDVSDHFMERPAWSGRSPGEEVANVPVTFSVNWRLFHNDGSMDEGRTTWGYRLARGSPDSPWRIFGQGVG